MTDYLKVFADAVYKRFNVDAQGATLKALATGGMFPDEASQNTTPPYIVYDLLSDESIRTYDVGGVAQLIEQPDITFRCYADTKVVTLQLVKELTAVYDNVSLTVSGFNMIRFDRGLINTFKDPDDEGYVATVAYTVMM